jgi:hypothetical protein
MSERRCKFRPEVGGVKDGRNKDVGKIGRRMAGRMAGKKRGRRWEEGSQGGGKKDGERRMTERRIVGKWWGAGKEDDENKHAGKEGS